MADAEAALKLFTTAVNAARNSRIAISTRKQARAVLVGKMRDLANLVQVASGGDLPTLRSSGFPVRRTRTPVGKGGAPNWLAAVRAGEADSSIAGAGKVTPEQGLQALPPCRAYGPRRPPVVTTLAASHLFEESSTHAPATSFTVYVGQTGSRTERLERCGVGDGACITRSGADWSGSGGVNAVHVPGF